MSADSSGSPRDSTILKDPRTTVMSSSEKKRMSGLKSHKGILPGIPSFETKLAMIKNKDSHELPERNSTAAAKPRVDEKDGWLNSNGAAVIQVDTEDDPTTKEEAKVDEARPVKMKRGMTRGEFLELEAEKNEGEKLHVKKDPFWEDKPDEEQEQKAEGEFSNRQLARLALGSLAGESRRIRLAFYKAHDFEESLDGGMEAYRRTQTYDDYILLSNKPSVMWNRQIVLLFLSEEKIIRELFNVDKFVNHMQVFFGPGVKVIDAREARVMSEKKHCSAHILMNDILLEQRPLGSLALGLTINQISVPRTMTTITCVADGKTMTVIFSLGKFLDTLRESRNVRDFLSQGGFVEITKQLISVICRGLGMEPCEILKCIMNPDTCSYRVAGGLPPMHLCCICARKLHNASGVDLLDRLTMLQTMNFPEAQNATLRMAHLGLPNSSGLMVRKEDEPKTAIGVFKKFPI